MSVKADVDRGLVIRKQMVALKVELDEIEERLEKAGLTGAQVELVDEEREGRQFLARGTDAVVPVIFTADLLRKSFKADTDAHKEIEQAAGDRLREFYKRTIGYEIRFDSGKKFRAHAAEILGKEAPAFITACVSRDKDGIPKSATKVDWDRVEKHQLKEAA